MYFPEITTKPKTAIEAVQHSLDKWKQILEFCKQKQLPDNFSSADYFDDTCACCKYWYSSIDHPENSCPLNSRAPAHCAFQCSTDWIDFRRAIAGRFLDAPAGYNETRWTNLTTAAQGIVNALTKGLSVLLTSEQKRKG